MKRLAVITITIKLRIIMLQSHQIPTIAQSYQLRRPDNDTMLIILSLLRRNGSDYIFLKRTISSVFSQETERKTVGQHTSLLILLKSWLILPKNRVWTLGGKNGRSHENVRVDEFELDKIGRKLKLWSKKSILVYGIEECPAMTWIP